MLATCKECGYEADSEVMLKKHKELNHPTVVFKCDFCAFSSRNKSGLKRHIQRRHAVDMASQHERGEDGNFRCDQCDFVSRHVTSLRRHIFRRHVKKPKQRKLIPEADGN